MRNKVAKRLKKQARQEGRPDKKYVIVKVGKRGEGKISKTGCYSYFMGGPSMVALTGCDRQEYHRLKEIHKSA